MEREAKDTGKFSTDVVYRVWNDSSGSRVEIGEDSDGLDLVELRYVDEEGKTAARIAMTDELADIVSEQLAMYLMEKKTRLIGGIPISPLKR